MLACLGMSFYQWFADVQLFQTYCRIQHLHLAPQEFVAIQRTVILLHHAVNAVNPRLWHEDLLTAPSTSPARTAYHTRLTDEIYQRIYRSLLNTGIPSLDAAQTLYDHYITPGFSGIIAAQRAHPSDGDPQRSPSSMWIQQVCQDWKQP